MHAVCIICSELFMSTSEISGTSCGHTFHTVCLSEWISRSNTCPQCRTKLRPTSIIKLFFDAGPDLQPEEDPDYLRNKINELELSLRAKSMELLKLNEESKKDKVTIEELKVSHGNTKTLLTKYMEQVSTLKVQLDFLSHENLKLAPYEKEIKKLKAELKQLNSIKLILDGSLEEVEQFVTKTESSTYLVVLKKQLNELMKIKNTLHTEVRKLREEKSELIQRLKVVNEANFRLDEAHRKLEKAEEELDVKSSVIKHLNTRIRNLKSSKEIVPVKRQTIESPSLQRRKQDFPSIEDDDVDDYSGSQQVVESAKENEGPLQLKSCSLAAGIARGQVNNRNLSTKTYSREYSDHLRPAETYKELNILKHPVRMSTSGTSSSFQAYRPHKLSRRGYDGFGGHSKVDVFPSRSKSRQPSPKKRLKHTAESRSIRNYTIELD